MSKNGNEGRAEIPAWRRYLRFWGPRAKADLDDELAAHLDMRAEHFETLGLTPEEARDAAQMRFGSLDTIRRECLTVVQRQEGRRRRLSFLDTLEQDLRFALRMIVRQPGWTTVATITLALGIGASTAVFSVVDSLLIHPLAYRDADRVANAWLTDSLSRVLIGVGDENAALWRQRATTIEAVALFSTTEFTLSDEGEPAAMTTASVGPDFFAFTGLPARLGRSLTAADTVTGAPLVAILSEPLWRSRYGSATDVIGRSMRLSGKVYRIVGVADKRLRLPRPQLAPPDIWIAQQGPRAYGGSAVVRLKPGADMAAVTRELQSIVRAAATKETSLSRIRLQRPVEMIGFRSSLYVLSAAVVLLLLAACGNVAHLMLARSTAREREIAVRLALGAGRRRILRQLLTESVVLTTLGSIIGIALSAGGVKALVLMRPASLTALDLTELGGRAVLLAIGVCIVVGVFFGLLASLHAFARTGAGMPGGAELKGGDVARSHRIRGLLVIGEMALSAMLLLGATLVVRGVIRLQHVDRGFDARHLYSISLRLPRAKYPNPAARAAFAGLIAERARSLPGVLGVTVASGSPAMPAGLMLADVEGEDSKLLKMPGGYVYQSEVAQDFFSVAGITLREGQAFTSGASDRADVIISEGLAQRLWPGQPATGRRMRFRNGGGSTNVEPWMNVVGVAANIPVNGLADVEPAGVVYYAPPRDWAPGTIIVRGAPGVDLTAGLHAIVPTLDKALVPPPVVTGEALMLNSIASQRFMMTLLGAFAATTLALAGIGLFGVISYAVAQRRREIGIRLALGATPAAVGRRIVGTALALSIVGLGAGTVAGIWSTRLVEHSVFGIAGVDATSVAMTVVILVAVAVAGSALPTWRAMRTDPATAIRS